MVEATAGMVTTEGEKFVDEEEEKKVSVGAVEREFVDLPVASRGGTTTAARCYAIVTAMSLLTSVLFGLTLGLIGPLVRDYEYVLLIGFSITWLAMYVTMLRNPKIRYNVPCKPVKCLVLGGWCIPLGILSSWMYFQYWMRFILVLAFVLPISFGLTALLRRYLPLDRYSCSSRLPHFLLPVLLLLLTTAVPAVPLFILFHAFMYELSYGTAFTLGLPLALIIQAYVHSNIEEHLP